MIGKYAPTDLKYFQISKFLETDEAPAFNFTFRVLTPVVAIIITSVILYKFKLDDYTKNIYLISVYYVSFRVLFNILIGRVFLVNWKKQFVYAFCIVGLSYFMYKNFIIKKENLLPDFSNIANELWIIIFIFLYTLINKIPSSDINSEKRKHDYIKSMYQEIQKKYSNIIDPLTEENIRLKQIIYAIIIHENFNRPKAYRIIEYLNSLFSSKVKTYGIMQVRADKPISDFESVKIGSEKIIGSFTNLATEYNKETQSSNNYDNLYNYTDDNYQSKLIREYNHCDEYVYDIKDLANCINMLFYGNQDKNKLLFSIVKSNDKLV